MTLMLLFVLLQVNSLTSYEAQYFPPPLHPFDDPPPKLFTYEQLQGRKVAYLTEEEPIHLVSACNAANQTYK
jgi:hypothetical protein